VKVEVWSDVVCPWCYIGKRHFEAALSEFEHRDGVELVWRSFQLDPGAAAISEGDPVDRLATKYGRSREWALAAQARVTEAAEQAGLEFHLERAHSGNTFDAHRLLHYASTVGRQGALKERLMRGYFTEGESIGDHETLLRLAVEVGLDRDAVQNVLDGSEFGDEVRHDLQDAQELGIRGVPYFVIDRKFGISGAQPAELILTALDKAWTAEHPFEMVATATSDQACTDDSCAI
jgi:predicted DsbA family dithiol-disulfide isomerase